MVISAFLRKARAQARKSTFPTYKAGTVLARGSRVISTGKNRPLNNPNETVRGYCTIHAEVDAITKAFHPLDGATAYVVVINPNGNDAVSKPCIKCQKQLRAVGVQTVVYSNRGEIVKEVL